MRTVQDIAFGVVGQVLVFDAPELPTQIAEKISIDERGCWNWTADRTERGYGQVKWKGRTRRVHRVTYELLVGPLATGLTIDHLCRNRACANPAHLELVTNRTNVLRGVGVTAQNAAKTHCLKGHPLDGHNLIVTGSHRRCRACANQRNRDNRRERYASDPAYRAAMIERTRRRRESP